jgi:hypothetical protein
MFLVIWGQCWTGGRDIGDVWIERRPLLDRSRGLSNLPVGGHGAPRTESPART